MHSPHARSRGDLCPARCDHAELPAALLLPQRAPLASIPGWWIWAYWLSPFSWALRGIVVSEMTADRWSAPAPGNAAGLTLGEEGLATFGFTSERCVRRATRHPRPYQLVRVL